MAKYSGRPYIYMKWMIGWCIAEKRPFWSFPKCEVGPRSVDLASVTVIHSTYCSLVTSKLYAASLISFWSEHSWYTTQSPPEQPFKQTETLTNNVRYQQSTLIWDVHVATCITHWDKPSNGCFASNCFARNSFMWFFLYQTSLVSFVTAAYNTHDARSRNRRNKLTPFFSWRPILVRVCRANSDGGRFLKVGSG